MEDLPASVTFLIADDSNTNRHTLDLKTGYIPNKKSCDACKVDIDGDSWYKGESYNLDPYCAVNLVRPISENPKVDPAILKSTYSNFLDKKEYNQMTTKLRSNLSGLTDVKCGICKKQDGQSHSKWSYVNIYKGKTYGCHLRCVKQLTLFGQKTQSVIIKRDLSQGRDIFNFDNFLQLAIELLPLSVPPPLGTVLLSFLNWWLTR